MSNENEYQSKAIVSSIKATSRASVKVKDSFYTVEYCEERLIPDIEGVDVAEERSLLWDKVNDEVDNQVEEILRTFK